MNKENKDLIRIPNELIVGINGEESLIKKFKKKELLLLYITLEQLKNNYNETYSTLAIVLDLFGMNRRMENIKRIKDFLLIFQNETKYIQINKDIKSLKLNDVFFLRFASDEDFDFFMVEKDIVTEIKKTKNMRKTYNLLNLYSYLCMKDSIKLEKLNTKEYKALAKATMMNVDYLKSYLKMLDSYGIIEYKAINNIIESIPDKNYEYIYILKCFNDYECFYKIGKTKFKNINKRYPSRESIPYDYEVIYMVRVSDRQIYKIEDNLHYIHKNFSYKPNIEFNGYTECFSELNIKKINTVLKNSTLI